MAIVLALGAAAFYGSADFIGGLATRRNAALVVALGAQVAGLGILVLAVPFVGGGTFTGRDLAVGAVAGVFGGLGVALSFRALARGPMSVVAPTTALSAAAVPVVAGFALGERPGGWSLVGIVVALLAVALITRAPAEGARPPARTVVRALAPALLAGTIFGLFFVCLSQTGADAGLWPLVGARLASVPLLALLVRARGLPVRTDRTELGPMLASGVLDMVANVLFLLAARQGMLAVVAAVTGLYPASTIGLAQARLGERLAPVQVTGLVVAATATALVAV